MHWEKQAENARNDAQHLLENAHTKLDAIKAEVEVAKQTAKTVRQEAENNKKAQILEAKEEIRAYREQTENDLSKQRIELSHRDARLQQKEDAIQEKEKDLSKKDAQLTQTKNQLEQREADLTQKQTEADDLLAQRQKKLYEVAELSKEDAKKIILADLSNQLDSERAELIRNSNEQAQAKADRFARQILVDAIQSSAADTVAETTVSVVELPNAVSYTHLTLPTNGW